LRIISCFCAGVKTPSISRTFNRGMGVHLWVTWLTEEGGGQCSGPRGRLPWPPRRPTPHGDRLLPLSAGRAGPLPDTSGPLRESAKNAVLRQRPGKGKPGRTVPETVSTLAGRKTIPGTVRPRPPARADGGAYYNSRGRPCG